MFNIGVVPYLNALPLYHALSSTRSQIVRAVPSRLAPMLASGECDVALIPIVEHFRGVGEQIISDACVGSSGPVRSVLMFHRTPLSSVGRVAIDVSSRTSVALLHILLRDAYGIQPQFVEQTPNLNAMLQDCEAALLIGDHALAAAQQVDSSDIRVLDLGEAWTRLTGKSFVYAAWVTRSNLSEDHRAVLSRLLGTTRDEGVQHLREIAQSHASAQLSGEFIEDYLRHAIEHTMKPQHHAGLEEFRRRCVSHQLLDAPSYLR